MGPAVDKAAAMRWAPSSTVKRTPPERPGCHTTGTRDCCPSSSHWLIPFSSRSTLHERLEGPDDVYQRILGHFEDLFTCLRIQKRTPLFEPVHKPEMLSIQLHGPARRPV